MVHDYEFSMFLTPPVVTRNPAAQLSLTECDITRFAAELPHDTRPSLPFVSDRIGKC